MTFSEGAADAGVPVGTMVYVVPNSGERRSLL